MPQKLNKAGQLQEYVPAGNGDASGEYGYNTGDNIGGNKHFKSFKKPIGNENTQDNINIQEKPKESTMDLKTASNIIIDTLKQSDIDIRVENKGIYVNHNYESIEKFMNSDAIKQKDSISKIGSAYKKAKNEGKPYKIFNNAFSWKSFYRHEPEKENILCITPYGFDEHHATGYGTTWMHENGHLLDHTFDLNGNKSYSTDYISDKYNDTLKNIVDKEFEEYFTPQRKQEIVNEIEDFRANFYKEKGFDIRESERQKKLYNKEIAPFKKDLKVKLDAIEKDYKDGKIGYFRKLREQQDLKNEFKIQTYNIETKFKGILGKKDKAKIEKELNGKIYQNFSTITDMYSSLKKGRLHAEYGGYHDKDYWEKDDNKRVKEFFAEAFSSYSLGNIHFEKLQKAFPKSIEVFKEIYNKIK